MWASPRMVPRTGTSPPCRAKTRSEDVRLMSWFRGTGETVGKRAKQIAALAAVTLDALRNAADSAEHGDRWAELAHEQIFTFFQRFQPHRFELVQPASRRLRQLAHARQNLADVSNGLSMQQQTDEVQTIDSQSLGLRHLAELM